MDRCVLSLMRHPAALALSAALAGASAAGAQPFEAVYGSAPATELAGRRVTPVQFCPGGGTISVGTKRVAGLTPDVYVVRAAPGGASIWELTYDIGPGGSDAGESLAELADGSGFVITGSTILAGSATSMDVLLMKVGCGGGVVWAHTYHGPLREAGFDVIEAASGDPLFGTKRGDLVVAGVASNPAGGTDALLLRTNAFGGLIWNRRYDAAGAQELFRGLTEARPSGPTTAGDIVAVGSHIAALAPAANEQGYMLRVSGNTGVMTVAPHCGGLYGGPDAERFQSVVELKAGLTAGQLAVAGSSRSVATASDIFLVRTLANCAPAVQRRIGNPAAHPLGEEMAFDLKEVLAPLPIAPAGRLALTGSVGRPATLESDAFLLIADAVSLAPAPGSGRLYGDHGLGREVGRSLSLLPTGFLIGGDTNTDFQGIGDPGDLYLVHANGAGLTSCQLFWNPPHVVVAGATPVSPASVPFLQQVPQHVLIGQQNTAFRVCP